MDGDSCKAMRVSTLLPCPCCEMGEPMYEDGQVFNTDDAYEPERMMTRFCMCCWNPAEPMKEAFETFALSKLP